jgi:hypothetical protein
MLKQLQATRKAEHVAAMKEAATLLKLSEMRGMEYSPAKDDSFFQPSKSTAPSTANSATTAPQPPISPATNQETSKPRQHDLESLCGLCVLA